MPRAVLVVAVALASLTLGEGAPRAPLSRDSPSPVAPASVPLLSMAPCPAGALPDGDVCVHAQDPLALGEAADPSASTLDESKTARLDQDAIPRRPDRPTDYDLYRYPIPCSPGCVVRGSPPAADARTSWSHRGAVLDDPSALASASPRGLELRAERGTPVTLVSLEHQVGRAKLLYAGPLRGRAVVTLHLVRESGQEREYLLLVSRLAAVEPDRKAGESVDEGAVLGWVGTSATLDTTYLHVETWRVRGGVDVGKLAPSALWSGAATVPCDPRNVLPLRAAAAP